MNLAMVPVWARVGAIVGVSASMWTLRTHRVIGPLMRSIYQLGRSMLERQMIWRCNIGSVMLHKMKPEIPKGSDSPAKPQSWGEVCAPQKVASHVLILEMIETWEQKHPW